ncbi:MAG: insulinase family protein [Rothia sp. (in: high G+C Gram-positive bacteria)]|nr:insulinase family protein [Rothia sp. (in: high G+C Gram-positive bacteria)]
MSFNRTLLKNHGHEELIVEGLRAIAVHDQRATNFSISLAVPAGMRDEEPGQEGFFHLIEHMIYQDSHASTADQRGTAISSEGGILGGNTHMDYTEFYETGNPIYLKISLHRILEQVFFPAFKVHQLDDQVQAVATERFHRLAKAPGGVLPWPHLTGQFWSDYANGHDGSGDLGLRERATTTALTDIHQRYYQLGESVVVIISPLPAEQVFGYVERALAKLGLVHHAHSAATAKISQRKGAGQPIQRSVTSYLNQPVEWGSRRISVTRNVDTDIISPHLLGSLLVAETLSGVRALDASAGIFGVADTPYDDLFVLVDDTNAPLEPADRFNSVKTASDSAVKLAAQRAILRLESNIYNDQKISRVMARDAVIRYDPHYIYRLTRRLRNIENQTDTLRELANKAADSFENQVFASLIIGTNT